MKILSMTKKSHGLIVSFSYMSYFLICLIFLYGLFHLQVIGFEVPPEQVAKEYAMQRTLAVDSRLATTLKLWPEKSRSRTFCILKMLIKICILSFPL